MALLLYRLSVFIILITSSKQSVDTSNLNLDKPMSFARAKDSAFAIASKVVGSDKPIIVLAEAPRNLPVGSLQIAPIAP
jgi:hypothetical protein